MSGPFGYVVPALTIGLGTIAVRPKRGIFPNADVGPQKPIIAQAVVEEDHRDTLTITEHPVEAGAAIADHAFKNPAEVAILMGWSNSPSGTPSIVGQAVGLGAAIAGRPVGALASIPSTIRAVQSILSGNSQDQIKQIYQDLLQLQSGRVPFDLFTGKRTYKQMLLQSLIVKTDETKENILWVRATCRQILIATTQTVTVPANPDAMEFPDQTQPTQDLGAVQLGPAPTIAPDGGTLTGALNDVSGAMATVEKSVALISNPQGALSQLPGAIGAAQDAVVGALQVLPNPFNVPFSPGEPQTFSIDLGSADLTGEQEDALSTAKDALASARKVVAASQQQVGSTSSAPAGFGDQLTGLKAQIDRSLSQIKRISP